MSRQKIAQRAALRYLKAGHNRTSRVRVAASKGIYNLSPEGFDMAEACPFIDSGEISLGIALACEIAAQAEDTIEGGGSYTAQIDMTYFKGRDLVTQRLDAILEAEGMGGIYADIQKSRFVHKAIKKVTRGGQSWSTDEFLDGNMPIDAITERNVMYYVREGYMKADYPQLYKGLGRVPETARGILRDLGVQMTDSQLDVTYARSQPTSDPMRIALSLNAKTFYEDDPLVLTDEILRPSASIAGQDFLVAKGEAIFRIPHLGGQNLDALAAKLQALNGALNHPDEAIKAEAWEWVKSPRAKDNLYVRNVHNPNPSKEVKAAARGFIKRIHKDYENATFDEGRLPAAKKFFGTDTKMLLQKCWNKSAFKQAFGAFKVSDELLELMLMAVGKRVAPLRRSKDEIASIKAEFLTDVVALIMVHCALHSMGVKLKPDLRYMLRL